MTCKRKQWRQRGQKIRIMIDDLRRTIRNNDAETQRRVREAVAYERENARERALRDIVEHSFAKGDKECFLRGIERGMQEARYEVGAILGDKIQHQLAKHEPMMREQRLLMDKILSVAMAEMSVHSTIEQANIVRNVCEVSIPPIYFRFQI